MIPVPVLSPDYQAFGWVLSLPSMRGRRELVDSLRNETV